MHAPFSVSNLTRFAWLPRFQYSQPIATVDEAMAESSSQHDVHIPAPAYQTESASFKLDLSCLADASQQSCDFLDAIKTIDILSGEWPTDALHQATTLDQSQMQALKVCVQDSGIVSKHSLSGAIAVLNSTLGHSLCSIRLHACERHVCLL